MSGRTLFAIVAGSVLALALLLVVVIPGVERGGWGEIAGVLALIGAALVVERVLRRVGR